MNITYQRYLQCISRCAIPACGSYHIFLDKGLLLTRGYVEVITSKVLRSPPRLG